MLIVSEKLQTPIFMISKKTQINYLYESRPYTRELEMFKLSKVAQALVVEFFCFFLFVWTNNKTDSL